jgi:Ca2+-binding RTX toxin-like protein
LSGDLGNDRLSGGNGSDNLFGGPGDDSLFGEAGNDGLDGDDGNDRLFGGDGSDFFRGDFGNDILDGGAGNDLLNGADQTFGNATVSRGRGEIDVLTGGVGGDTFILQSGTEGFEFGPSYLGNGNSDYALISDFNKNEDVIRLAQNDVSPGSPPVSVEYSLGASPSDLPEGTAIFVNNLGAKPDLIAILQGVSPNSLNLTEPYFNFSSSLF